MVKLIINHWICVCAVSAKTWSDIWSMNLQDLASFGDKNQNDPKYQKVSRLIHLCQEYGVRTYII